MKTRMRPRYYCDHCQKGSGSPSAMRRHEASCTLNPRRRVRIFSDDRILLEFQALTAQAGGKRLLRRRHMARRKP